MICTSYATDQEGIFWRTTCISTEYKSKSERDFAASQIKDSIKIVKWEIFGREKGNRKTKYCLSVHTKCINPLHGENKGYKVKTMKKSTFQSAIDAWPEDEARAVFEMFPNLYEDEGPEYAQSELEHDCERFKKIFARESDSEELFARFMVKINELKDNYLSAKA